MAVKTKATPATPVNKLLRFFENYQDTCTAILDSHTFTEDALDELIEADKNFRELLENFTSIEDADFDEVLERLKALNDNVDFDSEALIELCDQDAVIEAAKETSGCIVIEMESLLDKSKVEDFINKEIYPYNLGENHYLQL